MQLFVQRKLDGGSEDSRGQDRVIMMYCYLFHIGRRLLLKADGAIDIQRDGALLPGVDGDAVDHLLSTLSVFAAMCKSN